MVDQSKVIGIGETVYDIIFKNDQPISATPGGSTFNSMISLGRTKTPCTMVTETGDDYIGELTCQYLEDNGVNTNYVNRRKGIKSHISLAFLDENDDAQYQFYKDHANDKASELLPQIKKQDFVLFGSFYAINPVIRPTVKSLIIRAHEVGAIIYYDINFRASHIAEIPQIAENITENFKLSTIVRGSLEDFGYLYGTQNVVEIYEKHIAPYCPFFICTNGSQPVHLFTPNIRHDYPTQKVNTISTIGAGDNFNAGFIYAFMKRFKAQVDLNSFSIDDWSFLITTAQSFSSNVCQSISNSISYNFAKEILLSTND